MAVKAPEGFEFRKTRGGLMSIIDSKTKAPILYSLDEESAVQAFGFLDCEGVAKIIDDYVEL